ncbi:MAG: hypothetical protein V3V05_04920 [Pontiella sp.]
MKKTIFVSAVCTMLTGICVGGLTESLESRFSSVTAKEDGVLIVLKERRIPDRVSIPSYGVSAGENEPKMRSSSELGEYFIPYGFKWPVRIGQRDTSIRFKPLVLGNERKGFSLHEKNMRRKWQDEATGVLIYVDNSSPDGRSYEIIDEKNYRINFYPGGVRETNVYARTTAKQMNLSKVSNPGLVPALSDEEQPVQETLADAVCTYTALSDAPEQATEGTSPGFRWLAFPIIGILLVALLTFFKLRKR